MDVMKFLGIVFLTIASVTVILEGCSQFNRSMERSLANDKSYGRGVVEYHRKHPNKRNDGVTVTWSTADYVAMAIAKENLEGEWAKPSDQLSFLPDNIKVDTNGRPFCVIQRTDSIIVLAYWNKTQMECTLDATRHIDDSHIVSGDMEFSGRTDYWIYVLKTARIPAGGCVVPPDLYIIRSDKQSKRFFLEASEAYLSLRSEVKSRLKGLDAFVQRCEPSWRGIWSASFFSVPRFAAYKTDPDVSEAVKNGEWGKAYVGEFDRNTQILTILPLDSAKRQTEKLIVSR
jgi:hypothetical protein